MTVQVEIGTGDAGQPSPGQMLFELGDYTSAAAQCSESDWRKFAALGLIGRTQLAVQGLSRFNDSDARYYLGVALWIGGEDALALRALREAATPAAAALQRFVEKPKISVLGQLPWPTDGGYYRDTKFKVSRLGYDPGDLPNAPFVDVKSIADLDDAAPDFYLCNMVEWHDIPPTIRSLGIPVIGATADYDAHIQNIGLWLQMFDELIVACPSAWRDVRAITRGQVPVSCFPKIYGIEEPLPLVPTGEREYDVYTSGFIVHPYNRDKAELFLRVLDEGRLRFHSHLGVGTDRETYYRRLAEAKATYAYVRREDEVPTRALEGLALGCAVAAQRGTALSLYVGEQEGLFAYDSPAHLVEVLRQIQENWSHYRACARLGAAVMRQEWSRAVTVSQFLRYSVFLAARPRMPRRDNQIEYLPQKDFLFMRGALLPQASYAEREMILLSSVKEEVESALIPHRLLDTAREVALGHARRSYVPAMHLFRQEPKPGRLELALELYRMCGARFVHTIVPKFNRIRMALHFGTPRLVSEALQEAADIVQQPPELWKIDLLSDIFPFDFLSAYFNYRGYLDCIMRQIVQGEQAGPQLVQHIYASLYSYVGHYHDGVANLRRAVALDPTHAYYQLALGRELVRSGAEYVAEAVDLLLPVARASELFVEAYEILDRLARLRNVTVPGLDTLRARMKRYEECVKDIDPEPWSLAPLARAGVILPG